MGLLRSDMDDASVSRDDVFIVLSPEAKGISPAAILLISCSRDSEQWSDVC